MIQKYCQYVSKGNINTLTTTVQRRRVLYIYD